MASFVMGIAATLLVQLLWRKGYGDQVLFGGLVACVVMLVLVATETVKL